MEASLETPPATIAAQPSGHSAGPDRFGPLRLLRRTPGHIWLITMLFGLLLASWSVLVPQYHAPDEPNQVDAVMRLVQGRGWPHPGSAVVTPDGVGAIRVSPFGSRDNPYGLTVHPIPERDAVPRAQRPAWNALAHRWQPLGSVQQIVQHPPLYYWVGAAILKAIPGGGDTLRWDVTIGLLRMISVLMVTPLPLLAHAAMRRLSPSPAAATVAALTPLAVPQLTHIGSTVNNDNLLVLLGGLVTVTVSYVLSADTSARTACWAGLFTGLALLTKSFAVVLIPMVAAAYLTGWLRGARFPVLPVALFGGLAIAAGGWWWFVNIFRWGTVQPQTPGFPPGEYVGGNWDVYWTWMSETLLGRWWGSIGWYEVDIPWSVVLAASTVVLGLAACGMIRAHDRIGRTNLLFMLWPTFALFVLVGGQAAIHVADTAHITAVSGRYLFTGFTGVAVLIGAGAAALGHRFARWTPPAAVAGAAAIQGESVRLVVNHFWRPDGGGLTGSWHAMAAWSPWAPTGVKLVFTATVVAAALTAVAVWRAGRTRPTPPPPAPPPAPPTPPITG